MVENHWHSFPEEYPRVQGNYVVYVRAWEYGTRLVSIAHWNIWEGKWDGLPPAWIEEIAFWCDLPAIAKERSFFDCEPRG